MKKTYALIAVVSFIFGLAAGIIFALVKISKKFEYELETMFAGGGSDDPDIEELYTIDGFDDFSDIGDE
ncbi:MAG: hypothetical protein HDT46_11605 [Ruminococcaceae bacterium]|nr:hypothetical protein [Oscillospiraceae bacterium]